MVRKGWFLGVGLLAGVLLAGCGESPVPMRQDTVLGGVKEGAPLGRDVADPGLLADLTTYQPAKLPAGSAETSAPEPRGPRGVGAREEPGADADAEIKTAVRELVNALKDDDVQLALRFFNAEQVQPLLEEDKIGVLLSTYEKVDLLRRHLQKKLAGDDAQVEQLLAPFRGGESELKWEVLDAEHVSVTPNLTAPLFGPKATPTLQLARQGGEWRFQLEAPLTADDAGEIVAFHEQLQKSLDRIVDWVATTETVDTEQLQSLLTKALAGETVEPGAAPPATDAKSKRGGAKGAGEKKEEPEKPQPRGRGRGRAPGP